MMNWQKLTINIERETMSSPTSPMSDYLQRLAATCRATSKRCGWVGASDRLTLTERNARDAASKAGG